PVQNAAGFPFRHRDLWGAFLVFAYALWALSGSTERATTGHHEKFRKGRIALIGAVLGAASGAGLLLLLPFWGSLIEHENLAKLCVLAWMLLAIAATLCGIIGASKLRRPAIVSALRLPFWILVAALLVKGMMD